MLHACLSTSKNQKKKKGRKKILFKLICRNINFTLKFISITQDKIAFQTAEAARTTTRWTT